MLPGYAIADTLFAALSAGRGETARASGGDAEGAGDFEAMLREGSGGSSTRAKPSASQTGSQAKTLQANTEASAGITGQAGPAPSVELEADAAELPDTEPLLSEDGSDDAAGPGTIPAQPQDSTASSGGESTGANQGELSDIGPQSLSDGQPPATGAQADAAEDSTADEAGATPGKAGGAKAAGVDPSTPAAPAAPSGDAAPGTGKPAGTPAGQAAQPGQPESSQSQSAAPKAASGQQAPVQPEAPAQVPQSAPAGDPAGGTRLPDAAQTTATNAQQAKADLIAQPGKADGEVPNAAALRREMERGAARGPEGLEQARAAAEKSEPGARNTPVQAPNAAAQPATPAPAQASATPPQPAAPAASMAAMLTALQSGSAAPETLEASEGTELRLESSSPLLARNESASLAGTRTTSAMPHLRMASGHVADLGQMIARRFADGSRSFDIRLDPPELGRVQVRLEIGADRSVQAMLTADKPEALAELQRNARELEKALADAGLDLGENGIGFALSEGGGDEQAERDPEGRAAEPSITSTMTIAEESMPAPVSRYGFAMTGRTGVDMRI